jgi:hypothetical protein
MPKCKDCNKDSDSDDLRSKSLKTYIVLGEHPGDGMRVKATSKEEALAIRLKADFPEKTVDELLAEVHALGIAKFAGGYFEVHEQHESYDNPEKPVDDEAGHPELFNLPPYLSEKARKRLEVAYKKEDEEKAKREAEE